MTLPEVFEHLERRYRELGIDDVYGVFQFDISGPEGGFWHAVCQGADIQVSPGAHPSPDLTLSSRADYAVRLAQGKLNPLTALLTRKVRLKGDKRLMARLTKVLRRIF